MCWLNPSSRRIHLISHTSCNTLYLRKKSLPHVSKDFFKKPRHAKTYYDSDRKKSRSAVFLRYLLFAALRPVRPE